VSDVYDAAFQLMTGLHALAALALLAAAVVVRSHAGGPWPAFLVAGAAAGLAANAGYIFHALIPGPRSLLSIVDLTGTALFMMGLFLLEAPAGERHG
jgi:hypothetical protein